MILYFKEIKVWKILIWKVKVLDVRNCDALEPIRNRGYK